VPARNVWMTRSGAPSTWFARKRCEPRYNLTIGCACEPNTWIAVCPFETEIGWEWKFAEPGSSRVKRTRAMKTPEGAGPVAAPWPPLHPPPGPRPGRTNPLVAIVLRRAPAGNPRLVSRPE
jgi:hypothetical protein